MAAPPIPIHEPTRSVTRFRAVVGLLVAAAWTIAACGADVPTVRPTALPAGASAGPSASASTAVANPAVPRCKADDLTAAIATWQGSAGNRSASVAVASKPGVTCSVRGTPGVRLLDGKAKIVLDSAKIKGSGGPVVTPSDPIVVLTPTGQLQLDVRWSNWCKTQPARPLTVAFVLTDGGGLLKATKAPRSGDDDAPPCTDPSATAMLKVMHAWQVPGG
jgi:hypothetical protein